MTAFQSEGLITPRSRRIRTWGSLLLAAIIGMAIYGFAVLMPSVRQSVEAHRPRTGVVAEQTSTPSSVSPPLTKSEQRTLRALKVQVLFAYSYWGVCGLLVIAALFLAWLDFREVSHAYLEERRAILTDTVRTENSQTSQPDTE